MNDGMITFTLVTLFLFLLIGEWFEKEIKDEGWRSRTVFLCLLFIVISPQITVFSNEKLKLTLSLFIIPAIALVLILKQRREQLFSLFSSSLLVATVLYLVEELFLTDPVLLVFDSRLMLGLVIGTLSGFMIMPLGKKWLVLFLGMSLGWSLFLKAHYAEMREVTVFSYYEVDMLFITILYVSLFHYIVLRIRDLILRLKAGRRRTHKEALRSSNAK